MTFPTGKCTDMCSLLERTRRENERLLHQFEILDGTENHSKPKADVQKAIKEFRRSAAGQKQATLDEIRPPHVLRKTIDYMMNRLLLRDDVRWIVVYDFLFDRIRSIRQDLVLQQLWNEDSVYVLEAAVRFYIYAQYRLCDEPETHFNSYINATHLQECLKHLLVLYRECFSTAHLEMTTFYLLHNLGSCEALLYSLGLPKAMRDKKLLQTVIKLSLAKLRNNFLQVFRLLPKLPTLQLCAVFNHVEKLQIEGIIVMNFAFGIPNCKYPLSQLGKILFFNDKERAISCCNSLGVAVIGSNVCFSKKRIQTLENYKISKKIDIIDEKLEKEDIRLLIQGS